ncbi:MAG: hypothetical protein M3O36_01050 [Myxococcota bacterium]|nr:hypothetical protein [Myxococcota bacterium]
MSFNSMIQKAYSTGTQTAFTAPLASMKGSLIALNTVVAGTTTSTAGLVLNAGGAFNLEWDSVAAIVETNVTTTSLTVTAKWQVSNDGTNWIDLLTKNSAANVQKAATGTGSLVTTQFVMSLDGVNPAFPYLRAAVLSAGATGGAGDSCTIAYNFRKRSVAFG